jgi:hypothetical protein
MRTRRQTLDRVAYLIGGVLVAAWLSYGYELSTGRTMGRRYHPSQRSTPRSLESSKRMAVGVTLIGVPLVAVYFGLLRPEE